MAMMRAIERQINEIGKYSNQIVELVISPSSNAAQLYKFICGLEERVDDKGEDHNFAKLVYMTGNWQMGTVVGVSLRPIAVDNLTERLGNIEGVQAVDEEPAPEGTLPDLPKKLNVPVSSFLTPIKRMRVTLGSPVVAPAC